MVMWLSIIIISLCSMFLELDIFEKFKLFFNKVLDKVSNYILVFYQ